MSTKLRIRIQGGKQLENDGDVLQCQEPNPG